MSELYAPQLKDLRRKLGRITQAELADLIGAKRTQLAQWEAKDGPHPPEKYLEKLRDLGLGKPAEDWPFYLRIRATPRQLKLLIDIVCEPNASYEVKENARQELLHALALDDLSPNT